MKPVRSVFFLALCATLVVSFFIAYDMSARAENPPPTGRKLNHPNQSSLPRPILGGFRTIQLGGDADWTCLANDDEGGFLVPWYTPVEVSMAGAGWLCLSMTIDGGHIAIDTTTGVVTDSHGNDGFATCTKTQASGYYSFVTDRWAFNPPRAGTAVLRSDGLCASDFDGGVNADNGAPCRTDIECHADGGSFACAGGTLDGGTDRSSDIDGAYLCWTSGAVNGVHIE